jgi:hypothetical protein
VPELRREGRVPFCVLFGRDIAISTVKLVYRTLSPTDWSWMLFFAISRSPRLLASFFRNNRIKRTKVHRADDRVAHNCLIFLIGHTFSSMDIWHVRKRKTKLRPCTSDASGKAHNNVSMSCFTLTHIQGNSGAADEVMKPISFQLTNLGVRLNETTAKPRYAHCHDDSSDFPTPRMHHRFAINTR